MTRPRLYVALDVADAEEAIRWAGRLAGRADGLKVGLELFTAAGPELVRRLAADGWPLFLDLKLHDIPATVAGAVRSCARLGVELLTLHASGGEAMLRAAVAARGGADRPRLLAVTVLTSLDDGELGRLGWRGRVAEIAVRWAALAVGAGCDGVVASVREAEQIRRRCGEDCLIVAPGIRPAGSASDDQARVATPGQAARAGVTHVVVGRPILRAARPEAVAEAILAELRGGRGPDQRSNGGG